VQIAQEVENVIRHAKLNSKNEEPAQSEEAEKKTDKGQQEKKDKKAAFADRKDNRKGDFRGGFRRDSNPDVVYGRDFEGEPVALRRLPVRWVR
jgi:DNA polymerase-3 subunit alpha (Gram-positive type)